MQVVQIDARRVFGWHLAVIGCLALGHLIATVLAPDMIPFTLGKVRALFDLDEEAGPAAFFSSLALLACAGAAAMVAGATADRTLRRFWILVAAIAAFLAVDEAIGIHEKFGVIGDMVTSGRGIFTISWWVIYPFALAPFITIGVPGLLRLDSETRLRLMLAGAVFVIGAVGFEILESAARDAFVTAHGLRQGDAIDWDAYGAALKALGGVYQQQQSALALIEETLEMTGAALALRAILMRATQLGAAVRLVAGPISPA